MLYINIPILMIVAHIKAGREMEIAPLYIKFIYIIYFI